MFSSFESANFIIVRLDFQRCIILLYRGMADNNIFIII